jgi:8-oxo-dGTP diphosphatase
VSDARAVDVVVGLVNDGSGRWLVNCRPLGRPLAGWWEFPGGKCQPGEAPLAALKRELSEELGIDVLDAEPVLALVHDYPDKRVRLDVWHVRRYEGQVTARDEQPLRWVTVAECRQLQLLAADWPIVERLPHLARSRSAEALHPEVRPPV